MISQFLTSCATFSSWMESTIVSVLLFGEYPYPTEDITE